MSDVVPERFKRCVGSHACGEVKPVSDFYARRKSKDELHHWCKVCTEARRKDLLRNPIVRYQFSPDQLQTEETKVCKGEWGCGQVKPISQFHKGRKGEGRKAMCAECRATYHRASDLIREEREGIALKDKTDGAQDCKVCGVRKPYAQYGEDKRNVVHGRMGTCKTCNLESKRRYLHMRRLKVEFGLTVAQYISMLKAQNYVCAGCNQPETSVDPTYGKVRNLSVDHCHETGRVRGLLCNACNQGLGQLRDSAEILERAISYLKRFEDLDAS